MKIWITRSSAFSIQCGGVERLSVWFREPVWVEKWAKDGLHGEEMFDDATVKSGIRRADWEVMQSGVLWIDRPVSFGKLFGYGDRKDEGENTIVGYVWNKLTDHFGNTEFTEWHEYERNNTDCCIKNFKLEIDIKVTL